MLPLTAADERNLLELARRALEEAARRGRLTDLEAPEGILRENCGAFVTLHQGRRLRGCMGYVEPLRPLYQTVRECTLAAALHDPRFDPVKADELPHLRLEISVLSLFEEIFPDQIEVGKHGLMVSLRSRRGLLLPQVAVEWKWDRIQFLEEVCVKAGLGRDAWRSEAKIQAFTARVFAEPHDLAGSSPHAA